MKTVKRTIISHLWFDSNAIEAVEFYISVFPNSSISSKSAIYDTPSGDVDIVSFDLSGSSFTAISAGPMFRFNESVSQFVYCGSDEEIERIYGRLIEGGTVLMPLGKYPWTRKYAWIKDRYGLSWQLDVDDINSSQKIVPALLFVNQKFDKIRDAISFYCQIFPDARIIFESPYDKSANLPDDTLLFAQFSLSGNIFNAMSSNMKHDFDFNEAFSFIVSCKNQEQIDFYWKALSEGGAEQPCGWVKDKFGVSWQIVPSVMDDMMLTASKEKADRVTQAMLKMTKFDIKKLQDAYEGK